MTLTELRYIVAVARERHFGRAAETCFVSQPTLSVAVKKLEEELGVQLFERGPAEVTVTPAGGRVVEQAQRALEEAEKIRNIAKSTGDPLEGTLRLGAIFTIAPYLLPQLIPLLRRRAPKMPLMLEENYTATLSERLKRGDIDAAIVALPFSEAGITVTPLYDEPFVVALAKTHPWAARKTVAADELARENLLLLGSGHCFRDQVLNACPALNRSSATPGSLQKTVEGSSLETIRLMVASGMGLTVLPASAVPVKRAASDLLTYVPFSRPVPDRRVVLASRSSFPRSAALDAIRDAVASCELHGATPIKKK
ncbi:MAG: hydrogen peroxide-inducible genes activator [Burkholderiales bacterium]|nr:hydrogen peroxide-inducible genes activator [Burkholderiales bacterium]